MDARLALAASIAAFASVATANPLATPSLSAGQNIRMETGEVTVNGAPVTVVRYTWRDSASRPRSVSLVPADGSTSGYAVQMTYQVADPGLRTVLVNAAPAGNGDEGFGYFVSHEVFRQWLEGGEDGTIAGQHAEDDSPYGRNLPSTGTANSVGSSQATHEYRLNYRRWGTVASIADPSSTPISRDNLASHQVFTLPVVIRWHFVSGQDYPLWSVDYDLSAATNHISTDIRGPYGVMVFNESSGPDVTALRWGDWYKFAADANGADFGQATLNPNALAWTWNTVNNGRRYNVLGSGQYEFGIVSVTAARGSPNYGDGYSETRGFTSASRPSCGYSLQSMPCDYEWAYQSFQYDYGPPARPKLAWGTAPFLGSTLNGGGAYNGLESEPFSGTGHISFGLHIVTGKAGTGTPLTLARAAVVEANRTLTITPPSNGSISYTVLGDTGGPYTTTRTVAPWSSVRLTATPNAGNSFSGWTGACTGVATNVCMITMQADNTVAASFTAGGGPSLSMSPPNLDFGFQFVDTPAPGRSVTVTNTSGGTVTISNVAASSPFGIISTDCGTLTAGQACTVFLSVAPSGSGVPLNGTTQVNGTLTITSNAAGSPHTAALSATGEKTLVRHYYQSILGRAPDVQGQQFWQDEAVRMVNLGASVNETWFVMAGYFFNSAEYLAGTPNDEEYVTDLYKTFFDRAPDPLGMAYWTDQLSSGLPRDIVMKLSAEVANLARNAETRRHFADQGVEMVGSTPEEMRAFVVKDIAKWQKVISEAGIKLE